MLAKLNQLFAKTSAEAKAHPNDQSRPYHTDAGQAKFPTLPSRPARSMARAASSSLNDAPSGDHRSAGPQEHGRNMRAAADAHDQAYPQQSGDDIGRHVRGPRGKLQPAAESRTEGKRTGRLPQRPAHAGRLVIRDMALHIDRRQRTRMAHQNPILTTETTLDDIIEER